MGDSQRCCPVCNTDYLEAAVADIAGGAPAENDLDLLLASLEDGLRPLEQAKLPTLGDSFRRMSLVLYAFAIAFFLLAGVLTRGLIFYLLAILVALPALKGIFARLRGRAPLSSGEMVVQAVERVFEQDAAPLREQCADSPEVLSQLQAMRQRIDQAQEAMIATYNRNNRRVVIISLVVLLLLSAGVGTLAVRNYLARKAEAAYALQPEWVKMQDRYLAEENDGEQSPHTPRLKVLMAMMEAEVYTEAETFFFDHCQQKTGDKECALLIAREYQKRGMQESLNAFVDRVALRYDSDTRKLKQMKR